MTTMTKRARLIEVLQTGEELTAKQIASRFSLANPTATISSLRLEDGYAIYGNEKKDSKGNKVTKYRLGTPSRKIVAAGYRALAAGTV
jgi:predicted transcriptional regulator